MTLVPGILDQTDPIEAKTPIFARYSPIAPYLGKTSIITYRKSTTRFQMSLRWTSYVAPNPKGGSKTQNGRFPYELHFTWRMSATKFLCV